MITIENNIIYRDSEKIGQIVETVAWMNARQAGRIIGQIKQAAGIEGLTFEIVDTPEEKANLEAPTVNDSLTVEPLSAPEVVDNPPASEPAVSCDDLAAGIFHIPADFGSYEENPKYFAQCFINTYGSHGYAAWLKQKAP